MDLLTCEEVAAKLRVSYWTLANWRRPGYSPAPDLPYVKIGKRVMYRRADVERLVSQALVAA